MTLLRRFRPHPLVVLPVLLAVGIAVGLALADGGHAEARPAVPADAHDQLVQKGRELFVTGCSTCHGLDGHGVKNEDQSERGPSLVDKGEAAAYFQLHTGRMPLGASDDIPVRKPPAYTDEEIHALVTYVGTIGNGPAIPAVDTKLGDLSAGGELYRLNCAPCHSATGAGGALSYGNAAPPLGSATALDVGTAVRSGPGQMPRFSKDNLSPEEVNSIAKYVEYLRHPDDPGGLSLGRLGPIPEGFLIWVGGMGVMLVITTFIAKRNTVHRRRRRRT